MARYGPWLNMQSHLAISAQLETGMEIIVSLDCPFKP